MKILAYRGRISPRLATSVNENKKDEFADWRNWTLFFVVPVMTAFQGGYWMSFHESGALFSGSPLNVFNGLAVLVATLLAVLTWFSWMIYAVIEDGRNAKTCREKTQGVVGFTLFSAVSALFCAFIFYSWGESCIVFILMLIVPWLIKNLPYSRIIPIAFFIGAVLVFVSATLGVSMAEVGKYPSSTFSLVRGSKLQPPKVEVVLQATQTEKNASFTAIYVGRLGENDYFYMNDKTVRYPASLIIQMTSTNHVSR